MSEEPTDNREAEQPIKPVHRRRWTRCGCIVVVVMAVLLIAGVIFIRMKVRAEFTDQQWAQLKAAEEEVLKLPPEWHQPAKLPPAEVVEFAYQFYPQVNSIMTTHGDLVHYTLHNKQDLLQRMRLGQELNEEEETSFSLFMADLMPLIKMSSAAVQMPDYTMELDLAGPTNSLLYIQTFSKYASIAALEHLQNGDAMLAVETAVLPIKLTKRPEQSRAITHLIAVAVSVISAHTLYAIADRTSDTVALQRGIDLLQELKPVVFPGDISNWRYGDTLGSLRFAAANGYPVDLQPQPLLDYIAQTSPLQNGHYYSWITKNFPADDVRVRGAKERLAYLRQPPVDYEKVFKIPDSPDEDPFPNFAETEEQQPLELDMSETTQVPKMQLALAKLVVGIHPYSLLLSVAKPRYTETEDRARVSMAMYDLTQIHFARRLTEVRNEAPADESQWLAQVRALETMPQDPFTSEPYKYSESVDSPYSVGPDRKNDGARIVYDATNGTTSAGDVWMQRK